MFTSKDYNPLSTITLGTSNIPVGTGCYVTNANLNLPLPCNTSPKELYDYCWLYTGDEPDKSLVLHEGRAYGVKSQLEKKLLVEFARMFPDIEVSDYTLKMRVW